MEYKYKPGETVYLVANEQFIEKAKVVMNIAGFVTIRFVDRSGGTRVRESRLYNSEEEAQSIIAEKNR